MSSEKPIRSNEAKKRKKISARYLENAGAYYLSRFSSSVDNFRDIMLRKIKKSCNDHPEQDYNECLDLLDNLIQKFINIGYLNDQQFAQLQIKNLLLKGTSTNAIKQKLRLKKVPAHIIDELIQNHHSHIQNHSPDDKEEIHNIEFLSALRYCKRKKIGPFNTHMHSTAQINQHICEPNLMKKYLGRLARAGFNYDIASKALNTNSQDAEIFISQLQHFLDS